MKQKIIEYAINYFNNNGFVNVSMRNIAEACNMSLSNLQYHFKTKQILIDYIVDGMYELFEDIINYDKKGIALGLLINFAEYWFAFQEKYLFFYVEISAIMQAYPTVSTKYLYIKDKRTHEIESLLKAYATNGIMKQEPFPNYYKSMADLVFLITNFHLSAELGYGQKDPKTCFKEANTLCYNLLMPSLTEQGFIMLTSIIMSKK